MSKNPDSLIWLWALLPLLLAGMLVIPLLDVDAFNGDEPASLLAAGILSSGPRSLADIWDFLLENDPRNAPGWPILLSVWGHFVGWSEFAIRALSLFIGLLTLAWVFRSGRGLFAPVAGLFAALLLGSSAFFLAYLVNARAYTLVALCATICLWCYWRVALHLRPPGRGAQAGLLLGSVGLLWLHYFGALLLPALGLFHLLFVPKNQRWWRPVVLFGLAGLTAIVQLPIFFEGLNKVVSEDLLDRILPATGILSHLLRYMTNGVIDPSPPFSELLLLALPLVLAIVTLWRIRRGKGVSTIWLLVFTSAALLALIIVINELFKVIVDNRIRYLMPLWPLAALLTAATLWHLARRYRRPVAVLLALWLVHGAWLIVATDFRYDLGYFAHKDFHQLYYVVRKFVPRSDLLIFDHTAADYLAEWIYDIKSLFSYKADPYQYVRPVHANYPYLWLLYLSKDRVGIADLPQELGRVFCERVLDEWGFTLERYALHMEDCPERHMRLEFDAGIRLTAPEITSLDGRLRLDAHLRSEDDYVLSRYSFAVHLIDTHTDRRVAQGDTGVGPGVIVPLRSEIDISTLPPGEYEVRVALYDWQTGERLIARDLETGESSDMHTLQRFRID